MGWALRIGAMTPITGRNCQGCRGKGSSDDWARYLSNEIFHLANQRALWLDHHRTQLVWSLSCLTTKNFTHKALIHPTLPSQVQTWKTNLLPHGFLLQSQNISVPKWWADLSVRYCVQSTSPLPHEEKVRLSHTVLNVIAPCLNPCRGMVSSKWWWSARNSENANLISVTAMWSHHEWYPK